MTWSRSATDGWRLTSWKLMWPICPCDAVDSIHLVLSRALKQTPEITRKYCLAQVRCLHQSCHLHHPLLLLLLLLLASILLKQEFEHKWVHCPTPPGVHDTVTFLLVCRRRSVFFLFLGTSQRVYRSPPPPTHRNSTDTAPHPKPYSNNRLLRLFVEFGVSHFTQQEKGLRSLTERDVVEVHLI